MMLDSARDSAAADTYRSKNSTRADSAPPYADAVTEIDEKVLNQFMNEKKWRTQAHRHITFRSEAFNLTSLDGLFSQPIDLSSLESLDVSHNSLEDLKCIEGKSSSLRQAHCTQGHMRLQSLRILKARRNSLSDFVCVMPTLRELDLSYNQLRKIPPTGGLINLEVLVLSHNILEGSWSSLESLDKLKKLDLADNKFNFKPSMLRKEVDTIASLNNLVSLRVKDNLFARTTHNGGCFPEYQSYILQRLRNLSEFDDLVRGELAEAMKIADALPEFDLDQYDVMVWNRQKVIHQTAVTLHDVSANVPTWSELTNAVDEGLMDAEMLHKTVKQVSRIVSQIVEADPQQVNEIWRESASSRNSPQTDSVAWMNEVESKMRSFLDNYMILIGRVEDNEAWRVMLIRSLAKLSAVHTPTYAATVGGEKKQRASLGVKCIEALGFLMKRSEDIEDEIMSALQEIVVEPLSERRSQADVPINTVQALCHLQTRKLPQALSPIVKWLVKMYCEGVGYPQPDLAHLLAVATSERDNAKEALDSSSWAKDSKDCLPRHVMMALENKKLYQAEDCREQYISHLIIIQNTATVDPRVGEIFQERQLHRDLMRNFKDFFGDDIDVAENGRQKGHNLLAKRQLNLRTCGHILSALTAVMSSREVLLDLLNAANSWGRLLQYLAIAPKASPVADPMLLSSSLTGMLAVLKKYPRENEGARQQVVVQIVKDLGKMKPMLEIIDANSGKYRELTDAAERHIVERENRKMVVSTQVPRFGNLHNPLVHRCFQSIVRLVEFFTAEAKRDRICMDVSEVMNAQERETLLFKLLEVPDDDLQDAVMECFKQVDLADMSAEEVMYLIRLLDNVKDVTSEADVLENIIRQMCVFAGTHTGDSGPAINKDNAEFSVNSVMRVLLRNAKSNTFGRASEEVIKYRLTQACILFLQVASTVHDLRSPFLRSRFVQECFPEALKLEDDLCSALAPDMVLERTWAGGDVENLLGCLQGSQRLHARRKVGFRVLSRIADVLEGVRTSDPPEMTNELRRALPSICKREVAMWDEEKLRTDLRFLNDMERDDRNMQQRIFSQFAGLDRIAGFLDGLLPDDTARQRAVMEETAAVGRTQGFVEASKTAANQYWEDMQKVGATSRLAGLEAIVPVNPQRGPDADDSDSGSEAGSRDFEAPTLEYPGRLFAPDREEQQPVVDLTTAPYWFDGEFGGALSIYFVARWDSLAFKSRVLDFGSGCPTDNIVIGNQGDQPGFIFEFFVGTAEVSKRLVVPNCINVGHANKYLCTVTSHGAMKVWRDGTIVGERNVGCAPRVVQRNNLYVGKSCWSTSAPFHGQISDLKLWQGKAMEWEEVVKEDLAVEDEHQNSDDAPDRHFLMKAFLEANPKDSPAEKQDLQGGLNISTSRQAYTISEQPFANEEEGHMNIAYALAAVLRACFAMLKVPANEKIRKDTIRQLTQWLIITRMGTLVSLVGPFSCRVAAKFLRLMSAAMELPAGETSAKLELVVAGELLSAVSGRLCTPAVTAARQEDDKELSLRGRELCTEIVRLTSVVCRSVSFYICSEVKQVQLRFTELSLERIVPIQVIKSIIQMLLVDSKPREAKDAGNGHEDLGMGEEIWELARAVLSQLLDTCSGMKHPILEAFSENLVSSKVALRPSFLSALLAQSRQRYERSEVELFLNSEDNPHKQGQGAERAILSVKVQVQISGKPLVFQNPRHDEASFICLLTNKGLYIIDLTALGYPERPSIVQFRKFADMTRLIKGEANQVLYVGWVTSVSDYAPDQVNEQFMVLMSHSESQRNDLFGKLYALSEPAGGQMRHRSLIQSDAIFRIAVEGKVPEPILLMAFALVDKQIQLFVLGEQHVYQCRVNFERWLPPLEDEDNAADDQAPEDDEAAQAKKTVAVNGKEGSEADQICQRRSKARMRFESSSNMDFEKAHQSLIKVTSKRELRFLDKVAFYPEKQPRMALFFENETVEMVFLDDTTREKWRKSLMAQLAHMDENADWSRNLESPPLALTQ